MQPLRALPQGLKEIMRLLFTKFLPFGDDVWLLEGNSKREKAFQIRLVQSSPWLEFTLSGIVLVSKTKNHCF